MSEDIFYGMLIGGGIVLAAVIVTAAVVGLVVSRAIRDLDACDDDYPINQGRER